MLRPGGVLNISGPQSMQLAGSNECVIPDESHHRHVRQYGRDFEQRFCSGHVPDAHLPRAATRGCGGEAEPPFASASGSPQRSQAGPDTSSVELAAPLAVSRHKECPCLPPN